MTVEDLKGVSLSPVTHRYLSMYIQLTSLYEDAYETSRTEFGDGNVDDINEDLYDAFENARAEIMKLATQSITARLQYLNNHTEI